MWRPIIQETVQGGLIGRRGLRIRTTDLPYPPIQGMWEAACQRKHGKSAHCSQKSHPVQNSPSFNIALPCKSGKSEFYFSHIYVYSIIKAMLVHDKSVANTFLQMIGKFQGAWWLSAIKRSINLISEEELQPENGQVKLQVEFQVELDIN